ncbi:energy-coupling factor ABC transporter permease [Tessaracoccus sp. MC1756]|uniref:energy-coupling factor ABC transporter permease n=1 Tax=Tessaracoccus sp. MC1756 TaxID=2760311 RepID=UPI00160383CC|nr:energy-coupling factor ABC transporter permease [Tessaracoccus sp. MC1756]MBB1508383.1 energy-coupling factor ABC transporter permease [Tessaracoccus sp. MC1756]
MHIAEGMLPPLHCAAWFAASAPFVIHGAVAVVRSSRERPENKLLIAAVGAFTLVLSALKLPSVTGSSSHPTGTGLGAAVFGPPVMALIGTLVLLFQALLLAHGGLTTLGANVFSFAVAGPWAAYGAFRLVRALRPPAWLPVCCAMFVANLTTYLVTSAQLALAFPDAAGGFAAAFAKFATVFALTQIPLAAAEGVLGVLVFGFLARAARPELVRLGLLSEGAHV